MRFGVHLGGLGDVAALDVGDGDGILLAQVGERAGVGAQPRNTVGLVIGDLHLVAGTNVQRAVDECLVKFDEPVFDVGELQGERLGQVADVGVQTNANVTVRGHVCI